MFKLMPARTWNNLSSIEKSTLMELVRFLDTLCATEEAKIEKITVVECLTAFRQAIREELESRQKKPSLNESNEITPNNDE